MIFLKESKDGLILRVFVLPKSSKTQIIGLYKESLKIKLKSPPVDGAANKELIDFIAKTLKIPKINLEIISGHQSKNKSLFIKTSQNNHEKVKNFFSNF